MQISFAQSAIADLNDLQVYYLEQGVPNIGKKFVAEIIKHIETLPANPGIGRMVPEFEDESIRELIHPPFRVVYLRENSAIKIVRVWRSERLLKLSE